VDVTLKGPCVKTVTSAARVSLKLCQHKSSAVSGVRLTKVGGELTSVNTTHFCGRYLGRSSILSFDGRAKYGALRVRAAGNGVVR